MTRIRGLGLTSVTPRQETLLSWPASTPAQWGVPPAPVPAPAPAQFVQTTKPVHNYSK